MTTLSKTSMDWLRSSVTNSIEGLFDDPYGMTHANEEIVNGKVVYIYDLTDYLTEIGTVGSDVDDMLSTMGTDYEQKRLSEMREAIGTTVGNTKVI